MARPEKTRAAAAQVVLPSADLDNSVGFFRDTLGFRLDRIFPADDPRVAVMSGYGLIIRLDLAAEAGGQALLIESDDEALLSYGKQGIEPPDGISIEVLPATTRVEVPEPVGAFRILRPGDESPWVVGRAGMEYRDLIPGRFGGAVIASHIRIPVGGPVPDYVHYHRVRFQLIFCLHGWVRLVYEDQGPPFIMRSGDCVLQPPGLRHRVLECSDAFEVVEVGCPAEHETCVDHELELPNEPSESPRSTDGQCFHFHQSRESAWALAHGLASRDTGIGAASGGIVSAVVLRPRAEATLVERLYGPRFSFGFVLSGRMAVSIEEEPEINLPAGSAFATSRTTHCRLRFMSDDARWLEVSADLQ